VVEVWALAGKLIANAKANDTNPVMMQLFRISLLC